MTEETSAFSDKDRKNFRSPGMSGMNQRRTLELDEATVERARRLAREAAEPVMTLARTHTTVSVERATLRLAGLAGADAERRPVGQPPRRRRPRRRRSRARRRAPGLGRPRRGTRPTTCSTLAQKAAAGSVTLPRARGHGEAAGGERRAGRRRRGASRRIDAAAPHARAPGRTKSATPDAPALDLPDRRHRRHLRGHPAGPGGRARGRRRHRGDPLDRAEPARLRARGRDPRGLRRHLRHAGELPADAGRPRRRQRASSAATSG